MYEHAVGAERNHTLAQEYYQKVIEGADDLLWDAEAKYPATMALYKLRLLDYGKQLPVVGDILNFIQN